MDNEQSSSVNTDKEENKMDHEREQSKPKGLTRRAFLKASGAAIVGAAAGLWLPDSFKTASADAPVTEVKPTRIFIPMVTKNFREPEIPLYLREFGAPERGVVMKNKVEQGGGNLAYVEMGDQELWNNLLYLRETYGRPDLKLEISFYSTKGLLLRDPDAPRWVQENQRGPLIYDSWAGGNGTFQNGSILFRYNEESKLLQFYITLPETNRGKTPTQGELDLLHLFFLDAISDRIFASNERGYSNIPYPIEPGSSVAKDLSAHPSAKYENGTVTRSALWVRLETIPTTGGK